MFQQCYILEIYDKFLNFLILHYLSCTTLYIVHCLTYLSICCMIQSFKDKRRCTMANTKQTSKNVATKASKILRSSKSSKISKSVAGSALSQTKTTKKSK